jgi:squalene-hopene/tetraprenyl-beta-curcumene cyclase
MLCRFESLREVPSVKQAVAKGIEYLKRSQEPDGTWYGRWGVNYIYGTWQALKGLMCAGESPQAPYIRKAVRWLESVQNRDGGWGETCDSYKDLSLKGVGKSTASQTAWAVMGLIAAGKVHSASVEHGIDFLLSRQNENGTWDEDEFTGTGFPDVFYLRYHLYRVTFPLFALAYYRNVRSGMPVAGGTPSVREDARSTRRIRPPKGRSPDSALRSLRNGLFKTQR